MSNITKPLHLLPTIDFLIILFASILTSAFYAKTITILFITSIFILGLTCFIFYKKCIYNNSEKLLRNIFTVFESVSLTSVFLTILLILFTQNIYYILPVFFFAFVVFSGTTIARIIIAIRKNNIQQRNVLIVGAGQNGKLIAKEIQNNPYLGLNVVGFLDDNMNTIEDEDSTIPILGLTCDSEAVIKDNNVKIVIIAVKSRMDSNILTDLVKGIPLGVKVWRMPKFYEKITKKYLPSKMAVNWLFYDCVKKKALIYAYVKRCCDLLGSLTILLLTLPLSIIAMIGIKLSDFGPIFYTQIRMGKFEKPFKMFKFRTMYQEEVTDDFDDDIADVNLNDKRIMPFGRFLRKFHIDELPQMINVLRGEMSIIGPRPVREEVYYENKNKIPFWECRNWVRPGWCGWQQININEPSAEERLGYDLYYIKHRCTIWEFTIFIRYVLKVILGQCK